MTDVLAANDRIAAANREIFDRNGVLVLNLMSSPGAGKTSLLERTAEALEGKVRLGVITGDIATDRDAQRLEKCGISAIQLTTGTACHLDSNMVASALDRVNLSNIDILMIENVGNLVCPAEFIVGEHYKVMILSVTEGDEKPLKYPLMFREASICIFNKIDLLPHLDFSLEEARENARQINPQLKFLEMSCKTGEGLEEWTDWLQSKMKG
jgi:hydrogenase nickel incorporation protein HypB